MAANEVCAFYTPRQTGLKLKVIMENAPQKAMIGKELIHYEKDVNKYFISAVGTRGVYTNQTTGQRPSTNGL